MELIFASHNENKVSEVRAIMRELDVTIRSLSDIQYHTEIIEDGDTLDENAWIKAHHIYHQNACNVISDDTGLEVDVLGDLPGVYSARYAGPHKNSEDNMTKLLSIMSTESNRGAQFRTVIAAIIDGEEHTFEGIVRGQIIHERRGSGGFGYDPIFVPDGYDQSFGELSADVKNSISHRAKAFLQLKNFLSNLPQT